MFISRANVEELPFLFLSKRVNVHHFVITSDWKLVRKNGITLHAIHNACFQQHRSLSGRTTGSLQCRSQNSAGMVCPGDSPGDSSGDSSGDRNCSTCPFRFAPEVFAGFSRIRENQLFAERARGFWGLGIRVAAGSYDIQSGGTGAHSMSGKSP
jgi:hypothetical protein